MENLSSISKFILDCVIFGPRVPVLISDLLFHFGICEGLQQGAPLVRISGVTDGDFYSRKRVLAGMKRK